MISMTGFGNGEGRRGPWTVTVELRSVNHRFLDVSLKMPTALAPFELELRNFLKDNVARGRVTVAVALQADSDQAPPSLDPARLDAAVTMLKAAAARIEAETGAPQAITLDHLLAVPDLFRAEEQETNPEDLRGALMDGLAAAARGLQEMKVKEGLALAAEMRQRLDTLEAKLGEVKVLAPIAVEEQQRRLEERLAKLLAEPLEPQRMAQEVAILADKSNINEECERLGIHIEAYRGALVEGGQVAKKINFLLQEMHREVNTMGSKTSNMAITTLVIAMKDEVESLREQIQNLE
ncbi:MAG TPA: YicC family protein [Candidatus Krumholzibacteria bacterium]|nr:YicC family protein [Candidatus Krumholzibacteria bacterium]